MKIVNDVTGEVVATYRGDTIVYEDDEFQSIVETAMIEGIPSLGGEPESGEDNGNPYIADTAVWLSPGDEEFDDKFWSYVLNGIYRIEE